MGPEDVVLFISYSGATRDMLETLRTAKASGAKIILLTHYEDSPGAAMADVVLRCGAQESRWIPAASPSRWRCFMWARCFCSAICWMTQSIPTKPRTAPARQWPSS